MGDVPVTAIVLTKNEEQSIIGCLRSLVQLEQVIVFDSNSTDRTVDLARNAGAEVVAFQWDGKYPKKKQAALELADIRHDWVLLVDADERADDALMIWLQEHVDTLTGPQAAVRAYDIDLRYTFLGRELRHGHRVVKRSLVKRGYSRFPVIDDLQVPQMWEVEGHYQPLIDGVIGHAKGAFIHDDPDGLYNWLARHNKYSNWEAWMAERASDKPSLRLARSTQGRIFSRIQ